MARMVSSAGMLAIDARDVEKTFRSGWPRRRVTHALRGVSLAVEPGSIFGLLRPHCGRQPTLGLDPDVSVRVRAHIARLRREQGITIVLTTHYMREADELCDEIAFIKGGQILARGTPGELKRQIRLGEVIALRLDPARVPWLAETPGVLRCVEVDGWVECTVDEAEKRLPGILRGAP